MTRRIHQVPLNQMRNKGAVALLDLPRPDDALFAATLVGLDQLF
jgi:hypothetical protein